MTQNYIFNQQMPPQQPYNLIYVPFQCLRTPQDEVGLPGINAYRNYLKEGKELRPVEVIQPNPDMLEFILIEGNHRSKAALLENEPGIMAYLLLNRNYRPHGNCKTIEEVKIVNEKMSDSPKSIW